MKTRVSLKCFVNDCRLLENLLTGKRVMRAGEACLERVKEQL